MTKTSIPYVDVAKQYQEEQEILEYLVKQQLSLGKYVGGQAIDEFEEKIAEFCECKYAIALNSGTDALVLGMRALGIGPGDEVITPPNSFVASTAAIVQIGATPVFADVLPDQNIDPDAIINTITEKTKAIMPVHLTGRICQMDRIQSIAKEHSLFIIEDAAQSIGSKYNGQNSGTFGDIGCFSAHPLKNLNACGDSGFATTNDPEIAARLKRLRNHGMSDRITVEEWGTVSRMDSLQAAILTFRLENLPKIIESRRKNAQYYRENLNHPKIFTPPTNNKEYNTYHTYVIQIEEGRDELQAYLKDQGIKTTIHYPVPIHLQPAAKSLGYQKGDFPATEEQAQKILTLPVNQYITKEDQDIIINEINKFLG